jgi:hypothetical protein
MHLDAAAGEFAGPYGPDEALGLSLELPHAAIATPTPTPASTLNRMWRWRLGSIVRFRSASSGSRGGLHTVLPDAP